MRTPAAILATLLVATPLVAGTRTPATTDEQPVTVERLPANRNEPPVTLVEPGDLRPLPRFSIAAGFEQIDGHPADALAAALRSAGATDLLRFGSDAKAREWWVSVGYRLRRRLTLELLVTAQTDFGYVSSYGSWGTEGLDVWTGDPNWASVSAMYEARTVALTLGRGGANWRLLAGPSANDTLVRVWAHGVSDKRSWRPGAVIGGKVWAPARSTVFVQASATYRYVLPVGVGPIDALETSGRRVVAVVPRADVSFSQLSLALGLGIRL